MGNPIKKLAGQTAIYGLSSIIARFLNYLLTPLWTKRYTAEQFGIITEMYAYVAFLVVFLTYGLETAYFRYCSKKGQDPKIIFSTVLISIVCSSALFISICTMFAQPIADALHYPDHKEYIIWFAIIVAVDAVSSIPLAKMREEGKAINFAAANMVNVFVNIGLNWFFLVYCQDNIGTNNVLVDTFYDESIGVGYVFISNLVATMAKFLVVIPEAFKQAFTFDKALYKKMVRYAFPLLFVGLAGIVNETLDRILLKRMLIDSLGETETLVQLGIYGANYKLSIIITLFIQAFRYAAEPFFFSQQKNKDSKETYALVMNYFVIVVSVMFLVVLFYIDVFKLFINNEALWVGLKIVPILLLANIFLGMYYNQSIWYKLSSKTGFGALISIFGAVLTIVFNIILIPHFGYVGSAWATLICYASMVVVSYLLGQKHFPIPYDLKKIGIYLGSAVALYFVSLAFKNQSDGSAHFLISSLLLTIYLGFIFVNEKLTGGSKN